MSDTNWIDWTGGDCPVAPDTVVSVQMEDAEGNVTNTKTRNAEDFRWAWMAGGRGGDIKRYMIGVAPA